LLQGKLPFAGSDWAPSQPEDETDEGKQTEEQQQQTSSEPLTQDEVLTREDIDTTSDKSPPANTEEHAENFSPLSDEIFGTDPLSSTKREELLKAVFEDNNITTGSQVQDTRQGDTFTNSHYNPDDWVDIPNDELI